MPDRAIILASASPRRRELLAALEVPFAVLPADIDERTRERDPVRLAEGLALRKARAVVTQLPPDGAVIGADTVVVLGGRVLGKPADAAEARSTLASLRGRAHVVVTGVAVVAGERAAAGHARAEVTMRPYADAEIERYVAGGSPLDKAGAYAIQDQTFAPVARCDGCECGVIGLPLWTQRAMLRTVAGLEAAAPAYERCAACPERPQAVSEAAR